MILRVCVGKGIPESQTHGSCLNSSQEQQSATNNLLGAKSREKPELPRMSAFGKRKLLTVNYYCTLKYKDNSWGGTNSSESLNLPNGQAFVAYPHRPMTLHSLTENSLVLLNHKILEANSQVQNVKLGGLQTCLSINRLWYEMCDMLRRLVGTTAPGHHDCSIQE
ncbi:uncharacterized protein TNCV_2761371 [Trichonephila clavipes]|nr:uncharacterized protein TNCV_2761371 [Trichonephila clavipes]